MREGRSSGGQAPAHRRAGAPGGFARRGKRRISRRLLAISSAAIFSAYAAGYALTAPAEAQLAALSEPAAVQTVPSKKTSPPSPPAASPPGLQAPGFPTFDLPGTGWEPGLGSSAPNLGQGEGWAGAQVVTRFRDGTFTGVGTSRHGSVEATVVIKDGAILSAEISRCLTRYSCAKIGGLPAAVAARQSSDVDLVSGATDSSKAYRDAVARALSQAS